MNKTTTQAAATLKKGFAIEAKRIADKVCERNEHFSCSQVVDYVYAEMVGTDSCVSEGERRAHTQIRRSLGMEGL